VGSYFGAKGTTACYAGALVFTALTLAYTLKGGLRSSIWTDAIHAGVFAAFLALTVLLVIPRAAGPGGVGRVLGAGHWTLAGGVDLLLVGLLQSLSYPFHDPVLTDRGFLADERTTLRAYFLAGGFGALAILLFGLVGVSAFLSGTPVHDDAPRVVASSLGIGALVLVNVVMLTSAGSTVDSTFSAVAKAVNVDLAGERGRARSLSAGRWAMVAAAILGNLPLFAGTAILKATTISGTMVMGLAPVFLLGLVVRRAPPLSFHLAFWSGIALGLVDLFGLLPPSLAIGGGQYAALLGVNAWGVLLASAGFLAPALWRVYAARREPAAAVSAG